MKMKKGQSAIEFVILVSFMILVFFIFFMVIQGRIIDVTEQQDMRILQEANNIVVSEVEAAFAAAPDFEHTFIISDAGTAGFEINITDNREVVSRFQDKEYVNFFPFDVLGHLNDLNKNNTVYHTDGIVIMLDGSIVDLSILGLEGVFMNVDPELCWLANQYFQCGNASFINPKMVPLCNTYIGYC